MVSKSKSPMASKTLWVAVIVTLMGVWDQLSPFIPPDMLSKALVVLGPVFAFLRFITQSPVKMESGSDE